MDDGDDVESRPPISSDIGGLGRMVVMERYLRVSYSGR